MFNNICGGGVACALNGCDNAEQTWRGGSPAATNLIKEKL